MAMSAVYAELEKILKVGRHDANDLERDVAHENVVSNRVLPLGEERIGHSFSEDCNSSV